MQVRMVDIKVDEMNLYDYVIGTYERICDLTEGRKISLNYYLNNVNAKFVNVALFKSVFDITSFEGMMILLTDTERFEELHDFGVMCQEDHEKEQTSLIPSGMKLTKTPTNN